MNCKVSITLATAFALICTACDAEHSDATVDADVGGELWLLQTRVFSDEEGTMGYVIPTGKLAGSIENERSIEQGGGGMVYTLPEPDGSFLLSYAEKGTLTRYKVTQRNEFIEGDTLSFSNFGVESGYGVIAWVDEHTAYWVDSEQVQLILFDPTDMTIDDALPIEGVERDGYITEFGYPVVNDEGVFVPAQWRKEWEDPMIESPKGAMLVHVDPATNDVTVTSDERCTSLLVAKTTQAGDTYWFSNNYNTYARIIGGDERGVADCALRLRKGEKSFDPDWSLDITERTGGLPADGVIAGEGSTIWLRVYDADKVSERPVDFETADVAQGWQWYSLDLDSDEPAVMNDQRPYSGHGGFGLSAGGRSFSVVENENYTESKLLELTEDGFKQLATVEGLLDSVVRVR